jgi:hypothetical protein
MPNIDRADSLLEEFQRRFVRSRRGDPWREHEGLTPTECNRAGGGFAYWIADENGPSFSEGASPLRMKHWSRCTR